MIVAVGLHESPLGRGEDLTYLLGEHGFTADLGVVGELGASSLPVAHVGCATFEITIRREGEVTHELMTAAGTPNPNLVAARVIEAIRARNEELAAVEHEWVGPEHVLPRRGAWRRLLQPPPGGVPARRHAPLGAGEHAAAGGGRVRRALLEPIAAESGCTIDLDLQHLAGRVPHRSRAHGSSSRSARRTATSQGRS